MALCFDPQCPTELTLRVQIRTYKFVLLLLRPTITRHVNVPMFDYNKTIMLYQPAPCSTTRTYLLQQKRSPSAPETIPVFGLLYYILYIIIILFSD